MKKTIKIILIIFAAIFSLMLINIYLATTNVEKNNKNKLQEVKDYYLKSYEGYKKECKNNVGKSCLNLSAFYKKERPITFNDGRLVPENSEKEKEFQKKGLSVLDKDCSKGSFESCKLLAEINALGMYDDENLELSKKYKQKYLSIVEKAEKTPKILFELAILNFYGSSEMGIPKDLIKGITFFVESCEMESYSREEIIASSKACQYSVSKFKDRGLEEDAEALAQMEYDKIYPLCMEKKDTRACLVLAYSSKFQKQYSRQEVKDNVLKFYKDACERGNNKGEECGEVYGKILIQAL